MDVRSRLCRVIRYIQKSLETIEDAAEGMQLAALFEIGFYFVEIFA